MARDPAVLRLGLRHRGRRDGPRRAAREHGARRSRRDRRRRARRRGRLRQAHGHPLRDHERAAAHPARRADQADAGDPHPAGPERQHRSAVVRAGAADRHGRLRHRGDRRLRVPLRRRGRSGRGRAGRGSRAAGARRAQRAERPPAGEIGFACQASRFALRLRRRYASCTRRAARSAFGDVTRSRRRAARSAFGDVTKPAGGGSDPARAGARPPARCCRGRRGGRRRSGGPGAACPASAARARARRGRRPARRTG